MSLHVDSSEPLRLWRRRVLGKLASRRRGRKRDGVGLEGVGGEVKEKGEGRLEGGGRSFGRFRGREGERLDLGGGVNRSPENELLSPRRRLVLFRVLNDDGSILGSGSGLLLSISLLTTRLLLLDFGV